MSALAPGQAVLHYRVLEILGQGGMGEVYKALDLRLDRVVALKVLLTHVNDEQGRRRLLNEARAASALVHPNVVTIHAIESDDGLDFIVMEFVEGRSLQARLAEGALPFPDVLELGIQLADALAAAHGCGIVHRDVKPANVVLRPGGHLKLLDFGLAKTLPAVVTDPAHAETRLQLTAAGVTVGTVAYMSPEQTRAENLDGRSDVFSVGCLLYEAATARRPFDGASTLTLMQQIAEVNPVPPSRLKPSLPAEFDAVVERTLAKDPVRRYTAEELGAALRALARREGGVRLERAATEEMEPFVGRERELARLSDLLEQASRGNGKLVFVTGEPGIGKTALVERFVRRARARLPLLLAGRGRCVEQYGTGEAYLPFLDALAMLLNEPAGARLAALLRTHAPTWCLQLPAAFGSTGTFEQLQRETIGATKERMLRELGDALSALAASTPVLLLLEDLHWADPPSLDLLRHLCQRLEGQRLLIVGTLRPEEVERGSSPLKRYRAEMKAHRLCEEIELDALSLDHVTAYLNATFAPNDFPADLPQLLHRRTDGHPLFATSLVHYLMERGDIAFENERWTLVRTLGEADLQAPEGVRGIIRRTVEALEEEDQRALQYASIEGEEFSSAVLAGLLGVDDLVLEERLDRLDKVHRVIRTLGDEELPDGTLTMRYRFAHALYQNVLYADLVAKRRMVLHRQAGELLLERYRGQELRIAMPLATHFERGRDFARAVEHTVQAGDNATRIYANAEAEGHYSHALELLERLPEGERAARAIAIHQKRGMANMALSRFDAAAADFRSILRVARELGDARTESAALNALTQALFYSHQLPEMVASAGEAIAAAERAGTDLLRAETMAVVGLKQLCYGELQEAAPHLEKTIALARSVGHAPPLAAALAWRGALHYWQTEYAQAERHLLEARAMASELRDGFLLLFSLFIYGLTLGNLGRMSEALNILDEALRIAARNGDRFWYPRIPNCIGWIYRELQDFDRALDYDRRGLEVGREHAVLEAQANSLINLAIDYTHAHDLDRTVPAFREVEDIFARDAWFRWRYNIRLQAAVCESLLERGDLDEATAYARRLHDTALHYGAGKYMVVAHQLLSRIAGARGETERAVTHLQTALELLHARPAPLTAWRAYEALGTLAAAAGDEQGARAAFREAAAVITGIAGHVADPALRTAFLAAPRVAELLRRAAPEAADLR